MYSQAKVIAGGLAHIPVVIAVFYFILTTFNKRALKFVEEAKSKKPEEFFALFCVLGSDRLDVNHKAKSLLGAKKVSFASREEAEIITNQIYGGISPLGLPEEIKVYIDENVMLRNKVFIGGGNRISKFFLKPSDLKDLTNGEVAELTQSIST